MNKQTTKATEISLEKRKEKREVRKLQMIGYIKKYPNQTAYSIAKSLKWPIATTQSLLKNLEEDMDIIVTLKNENNRIKKVVNLRSIYDFTYDYFILANFLNPKIRDRTLKFAKATQKKNINIQIEMNDGSIVTLSPEQSIEEYLATTKEYI